MTKEQAIAMANSNWWVDKTAKEIVKFQINEPLLCMPWNIFHEAVEEVVGGAVWTHEFADDMFIEYVKDLVK